MSDLLVHATERLGHTSVDARALFGTYPGQPPRTVDQRIAAWEKIISRGWCPVLLNAASLIRPEDDVTRIMDRVTQ